MSVLDETWRCNPDYPHDIFGAEGGDIIFEGCGQDDEAPQRARVAAAAPRMARMLKDLEWEQTPNSIELRCLICRADKLRGHFNDCELSALLREVGTDTTP